MGLKALFVLPMPNPKGKLHGSTAVSNSSWIPDGHGMKAEVHSSALTGQFSAGTGAEERQRVQL